jgi:hypothetical protein
MALMFNLLNRSQLSQVFKEHDTLRAFEQALSAVSITLPSTIEEAAQQAALGVATVNVALAALSDVAGLIQQLAAAQTTVGLSDRLAALESEVEALRATGRQELGTIAAQNHDTVAITGGMVNLDAGTSGTPSLKFNNEATSGIYREANGQITATQDYRVTGKFGCNTKAPQGPFASSGTSSAPAGGVGTAAGGWDTSANRDAAIAAINTNKTAIDNIITALKNNGIMS